MEYVLIRTTRKTIGIQIKDGKVIVRAPRRMTLGKIEAVLARHRGWIGKKLALSMAAREEMGAPLTQEERENLIRQAKAVIPERVALYAEKMGVTYGRITIRGQKTRWGSCSAQGNLNFNFLLMLAPPETLDSVIVHELAHRRHMDHSQAFYREIEKVYPDYRQHHSWLKTHGQGLLYRLG